MSKLCRRCGKEREPENARQACCKECRKIERREATAKSREVRGLQPWGQAKTVCSDCGAFKQDPQQGYCNSCRRKRNKKWALQTGRVLKHNTGRCPCGAERGPNQQRFCLACKAADSRSWRAQHEVTEREKEVRKAWRNANRGNISERLEYDFLFRLKIRTRAATNRYILKGLLIKQPCEVCGIDEVQAHHDDYTKPMYVRWLCDFHHKEHHRNEEKLLT